MAPSLIALTHAPSPHIQSCELTFLEPAPIDCDLAARQHKGYCRTLRDLGAEVITLTQNQSRPDAVFIEDNAVVLDEVAVLASMGSASRRDEPPAIEAALLRYRQIVHIEHPATLEGGDVLRMGRTLFVGRSSRTNEAGIAALAKVAEPLGYRVIPIPVDGCLHLKTACCALPDGRLLANRKWFDVGAIDNIEMIDVAAEEPFGANIALIGKEILISASHARTAALLARRGFSVRQVEISEFEKAEGGVTCLSILFEKQSVRSSM